MKIRSFTNPLLIEPDAVAQIERTASMPFVVGLAVMPDVHYGKGSTVGTVVATEGAIMPACVGVDIGCGMIAVRTNLRPEQVQPHVVAIREGIERRIPVGIGPYGMNGRILPSASVRVGLLNELSLTNWDDMDYMNRRSQDWRLQLGSLGGGNHFIEVCVGKQYDDHDGDGIGVAFGDEEVWVILHSGSRGVGNKTGVYWTQVAQKQAKRFKYASWLPDPDLAYLVEESEEFHAYVKELFWCQRFAAYNRDEMMDRVLTELTRTIYPAVKDTAYPGIEVERINCHHNYISREVHEGKNVIVTRKGAIAAAVGDRGLIPGSMGARSYIVDGLGHPGSYASAPHGAGRRMSRTRARKEFTVEQVAADLAAQGIEARVRSAIVDEAPGAYKDIDQVMHDAGELVRPTHVLRQIISVKGD